MSEPAPQKILVAVAWPYANGPRHIGHVAGFGVPADIFARYHRLRGNDVLMVSGTDEHGTPVMVAADEAGVSPREIADRNNEIIREDLRRLGLSYDLFTRTTTRNHHEVTRDVFRTLHERGFIFEQTTTGAFSAASGRTLPDRYIEGTCPICGFPDGARRPVRQLRQPARPGRPDRAAVEDRRAAARVPRDLAPVPRPPCLQGADRPTGSSSRPIGGANVRNFSLQYLKELKPRPVTRDLDWGVRVPVPGYEEQENKRIYVWIDAVVGYFSAAVEWARNRGTPDAWREWWQNPDARHYYFMGKDNIFFHSVIWPAQLLGYGAGGEFGAGRGELELPYDIASSEFLTMEGKQFSTSRGVVIHVGDFLSRYDPDPLRYFLTAAGPETQDTDFTWAEFVRRNNDELLANWGNLVNRTLTSAYRNFGSVPEPGELTDADRAALETIEAGFGTVGDAIERARFKAALAETMRLASSLNQYVSDEAPWATIKEDRARAATVLYVVLRGIDSLKILFTPFLPFTSQTLHELLGYDDVIAGPLGFEEVSEEGGESYTVLTGDYASWAGRWQPSELAPGQALREPKPLFAKLDPAQVVADELARMERSAAAA